MDESPPAPSSTKTETNPSEKETKKNSREPLFGVILLGAIVFFLLLAVAGIAWAIYGGVAQNQAEKNEPSITTLGEEAKEEEEIPQTAPAENPTPPPSSEQAVPAAPEESKIMAVSILNGGAAGGSAGKLVTALKQEGYTQVTASDSTGNYTGVVIYHAANLANEAEALKSAVAKTYPKVTVLAAVSSNKETSTSPLTIIIGR